MAVVNHKNLGGGLINIHDHDKTMHRRVCTYCAVCIKQMFQIPVWRLELWLMKSFATARRSNISVSSLYMHM